GVGVNRSALPRVVAALLVEGDARDARPIARQITADAITTRLGAVLRLTLAVGRARDSADKRRLALACDACVRRAGGAIGGARCLARSARARVRSTGVDGRARRAGPSSVANLCLDIARLAYPDAAGSSRDRLAAAGAGAVA